MSAADAVMMAIEAVAMVMAGMDADGQGFRGAGAQQGDGEGGENDLFHGKCPLEERESARQRAHPGLVPGFGNLYCQPPSMTLRSQEQGGDAT